MKKRVGIGWPLLLLLLCGVLGLRLFEQWKEREDWQPVLAASPDAGSMEVAVLPPTVVRPLAQDGDYDIIVERPLFSASRRPPEDAPVPVAEVEEEQERIELGLSLRGVHITEEEKRAVLEDNDGSSQKMLIGDEVRGWTLVDVEPDHAVFSQNEDEVILWLVFDNWQEEEEEPQRARRTNDNRAKKKKNRQRDDEELSEESEEEEQ